MMMMIRKKWESTKQNLQFLRKYMQISVKFPPVFQIIPPIFFSKNHEKSHIFLIFISQKNPTFPIFFY